MSHDTHGNSKENQTIISFKNSFWLVVIIVGLFVAALNFIKAESGGEEVAGKENKEATATEAPMTEKKAETSAEAPKAAETAAKDTTAKAAK